MVKNVGPAGLERIELKRLTERVGRLFSMLQEAAQEQMPAIAGAVTALNAGVPRDPGVKNFRPARRWHASS